MGKCPWFHRGIHLTVAECHMWSLGKNRSKALAVCSLNDAFKIHIIKGHRFLHYWKTQYHVSVVLFIRATLQPIWKTYLEPGTHMLKFGRQNNPLPMDRRTMLYDCGPTFLPISVNLYKDGNYTIISDRSTDTLRIPWWSMWMDIRTQQ